MKQKKSRGRHSHLFKKREGALQATSCGRAEKEKSLGEEEAKWEKKERLVPPRQNKEKPTPAPKREGPVGLISSWGRKKRGEASKVKEGGKVTPSNPKASILSGIYERRISKKEREKNWKKGGKTKIWRKSANDPRQTDGEKGIRTLCRPSRRSQIAIPHQRKCSLKKW